MARAQGARATTDASREPRPAAGSCMNTIEHTRAVVLAAGTGTRLNSLTLGVRSIGTRGDAATGARPVLAQACRCLGLAR